MFTLYTLVLRNIGQKHDQYNYLFFHQITRIFSRVKEKGFKLIH